MRLQQGLFLSVIAFTLAGAGVAALPARAATESSSAQSYLDDARSYLATGEIRGAIAMLKKALQEDPEDAEARFLLGSTYLEAQDGASAEKELRAAYDQGLDDDLLRERLAEALLLQGKYQQVLDEIKPEGLDPDRQAAVLAKRGRAYFGLKQLDDAEAEFRKAFEIAPNFAQAKTGLARVLIGQGKTDEALQLIEEALGVEPDSMGAMVLKGELQRMSRDFEGSAVTFGEVLKKHPNHLEALLGQAAALIDLSRDDEAQRNIDAALELAPRHPLALYLSALILAKRQEFVAAEAMLDRAGNPLNDYLPAQYLRGTVAFSQGNWEQAYYFLSRFVAQVPSHTTARRLLGATLVRQGNYAEAIKVLTPLVEASEPDARIYALVAAAYMGLKDYKSAVTLFEKAVEAAPEESTYRTQLGVARLSAGEQEAALEDFEAAVETDPSARRAPLLLARYNILNGDFDAALAVADTFVSANAKDPAGYNLRGAALLAKGDNPGALKAFEKALEVDPDFFPAVQNLARIDIEKRDFDAARARYQAVLSRKPEHEGAMIALSRVALSAGDSALAAEWLEKAMAANPESPRAGLLLIERYLADSEPEKALATASALERQFSDRADVVEALARTQMIAGEPVAAVTSYGKLADLAPNKAEIQYALGRAQLASGDIFGARASYRKALEIDPKLVPAVLELITLEIDGSRFRSAMEVAAALREAQPELPMGDILVGHVDARMGETDEAMAAFRAAEPKINSADAALRLFHGYSELGKTDDAARVLESWLSVHPDDRVIRAILAGAYLDAGAFDKSIAQHQKLREGDTDNPMILNNLAWLYQSIGDTRALDTAEQAYALQPDAVVIKDTYGWVMVEHGKVDEGAAALEEASALAPDEPDIQYHLALARVKQGRGDEACALLRTILSTGEPFRRRDMAEALSDAQSCR